MTHEKQNLIEQKMHYDNLRKEQEKLVAEQDALKKQMAEVANRGLSNFFLFRFVQIILRPIMQVIKGIFDLPPNKREIELQSLSRKEDYLDTRKKNVENRIKAINKDQQKHHSFDTITPADIKEYGDNVVARETEINKMRVENEKRPSLILKEFSQIKGWDKPVNRHKALDFVLEKNEFIHKFKEEFKKGNIAFEYDGKKYTAFKDDDYRTVYDDDVDIKDFEKMLSFAMGQDVVFDFKTMRYVGETFECDVTGDVVINGKGHISREQLAVMKEYCPRISKDIEDLAKEKHPDLLKYRPKDTFTHTPEKFNKRKNLSNDKAQVHWYNDHKEALGTVAFNKSFIESNIVAEFCAIKGNKKVQNPHKVVDYMIAKYNFTKNHSPSKTAGLSFNVTKDGSLFIFENGNRAKNKTLDINVMAKDVEAALTHATGVPMHYDFDHGTFKSALFEVDAKGNFVHSETMPTKEYKELSKFFKEYMPKVVPIFREIIVRDMPARAFKTSQISNSSEAMEAFKKEIEIKQNDLAKSNRDMQRQGKRVHKDKDKPTKPAEVTPTIPRHSRTIRTDRDAQLVFGCNLAELEKRYGTLVRPKDIKRETPEEKRQREFEEFKNALDKKPSKGNLEYQGETYMTDDYDDLDAKLNNLTSDVTYDNNDDRNHSRNSVADDVLDR